MKRAIWAAALSCLVLGSACAPAATRGAAPSSAEVHDKSVYGLIPYPQSLEPGAGWFTLQPDTRIVLPADAGPEVRDLVERWAAPLRASSGLPLAVLAAEERTTTTAPVRLRTGTVEGDEGYRLRVEPDGIELIAQAPAGFFYGLETLRQLLPVHAEAPGFGEGALVVPAVEIEDAPRFSYRGLHLDVGRHYFPVEFIKKYIDLMARYKLNTFHWHLTEDQGWRLEIKKYPRLTEVGSCRRETILGKNFDPYFGDGQRYCGYYTQEEAREIVEYARERFITVIPEIEMPGHSVAALAAYPELGCTEGPFEVATAWGIKDDIYCPKEQTFAFLEDVLTEVMAIFPSKYIHIGGDEAPKTRWEESPIAQAVIRREGLADEHELQSYFIQRMEKFLNAHGRQIIGWDEILEGGLAPNATVMSWRGIEGGIAAAQQGHDVVMTPTSHLYFDYYQGDPEQEPLAIGGNLPLHKVYSYEPIPEELTPDEAKHILGAQGNVWTEYMKTTDYVEYMAFPRALALAEVVWSPREARDWESFRTRLFPHRARLEALDVNYRPLDDVSRATPAASTRN